MTDLDSIKASLTAFVRSMFARVDYMAAYWCRVVAQNADGSLELQPDDTRFPGLSNVPVRYGVPGITAKVLPGARALLEFAAGDPSQPMVTAWEPGTVLEISLNGGVLPVARVGDPVLSGPGGSPIGVIGPSPIPPLVKA